MQIQQVVCYTRDGRFALAVDACIYGIGAVLYQLQHEQYYSYLDNLYCDNYDNHNHYYNDNNNNDNTNNNNNNNENYNNDNQNENEMKWYMVDIWSKVMPKQLRHAHSIIQEGYGAVASMEHWQFYLLRKEFDFSTDNMPVAAIFGDAYKVLGSSSQKQLLRLTSRANLFRFTARHIPGIQNPIADGLSRFTIKLINDDQQLPKEQQQYPPIALTPIPSNDTNTPPLTDEDRRYLKIAERESQQLEMRKDKLIQDAKYHSVNLV